MSDAREDRKVIRGDITRPNLEPSPFALYQQTGGGDAYRVAMLEHGHMAPAAPSRRRQSDKRVMQCGLVHDLNWSEWRRYGNTTEGFYEGRWCRTCGTTQVRQEGTV